MADRDPPMSNANPAFWFGLSLGGMFFFAAFMAWAAVFGFGHPTSQQQASAPQQTTGQAAPAQQKK
ncbi:MAG TPA: hypothetical protein VJL90_16040 [Pseudorhodoplanes sp.]|nr:hypothetical protein [Pseudorhodoplanes sp.]